MVRERRLERSEINVLSGKDCVVLERLSPRFALASVRDIRVVEGVARVFL